MRFWLIREGVESDAGFRLVHLHRYALRYEERGLALSIPVEEHLDRSIDVYFAQVRRWDHPNQKDRLDGTRLQAIRYRIRSGLIFEGFSPEFDNTPLFAPEGAWSLANEFDPNLAIG